MYCCHGTSGHASHFSKHRMPKVFVYCCQSEEDELAHLEKYRDHLQEELDGIDKKLSKEKDEE
ncbi:DUF5320 domain-containing protein [Calditrichota bacterium]